MDEIVITAAWRDAFVLVREEVGGGYDAVRARIRAGDLIRLVRGVYYPAAAWQLETSRQRHLTLCRAVTLLRERRLVMSHRTAAVVWDLPPVRRSAG